MSKGKLTKPSVDKDAEQLDLSCVAGGSGNMAHGVITLGKNLKVSYKVSNVRFSTTTTKSLFKRKGNIYPHKDLRANV